MWKIILIGLGLAYVLSPIDFLPDWFIGWGWLDDLVILGFAARFFLQRLGKTKSMPRRDGPEAETEGRRTTGETGFQDNPGESEASNRKWDPYRVLELERGASKQDIKQAYRRLANQYHPDKVNHLGEEFKVLAETKFKEIQKAYQELNE